MNPIVDTKPSEATQGAQPTDASRAQSNDASNAAPSDAPQSEQGAAAVSEPPAADEPPVVLPASNEPLPKFDARGASIVVLAMLATLFALQAASLFVIPLVVAVLFAYALDPFVSFLERRRVPRPLSNMSFTLLPGCCTTTTVAPFAPVFPVA